jgi:mannose-6-phosphate isomerase
MVARLAPLVLGANLQHHFYRGGPAIARFRGIALHDDHAPEDWVGSCTCMFGSTNHGLSRLPDGRLLRDAVNDEPERYLGAAHAGAFGPDPGVLVKLLDAGERLPVHWHPTRGFAREHLGLRNGKTEAWVILEADDGAEVHLGWRRPVDRAEIETWLAEQDAPAVLAEMRRIPVAPGDTVLVPASTPHAIGEGILLVELQEPTDLSVLLEWKGYDIDGARSGHLGLGFDVALRSVRTDATADGEGRELTSSPRAGDGAIRPLFPPAADPFFRADLVSDGAELGRGFSILVVTRGAGSLESETGSVGLARGRTVLLPDEAGVARVTGGVDAIRCRPPVEAPPAATPPQPTSPGAAT